MRVAIVGNSGSGKSTLASRLGDGGRIPALDLDTVAWEPGKVAVARPVEAARADVRQYCSGNADWIVEGCYAGLVEVTLEFDPVLVVLDPGFETCRAHCLARPWEPHKYSSKEEQDRHLDYLLDWIRDYYSRDGDMSLAAHKALYERYAGRKHWLAEPPGEDFRIEG